VIEARKLATSVHGYVVVEPGKHQAVTAKGYSLVIFEPASTGVGDPTPLAQLWLSLVNSRQDVVVAIPGEHGNYVKMSMITEIIDDTVAHDHVNPKHIFVVGHIEGVAGAANIVGSRPDLFAGIAYISHQLPGSFFTADMKKYAGKMLVYRAIETKEMSDAMFADEAARLKTFGFTNIGSDRPESSHQMSTPEFEQVTKNIMAFFDHALSANYAKEKTEAATMNFLAKSMLTQNRTLAKPPETYVFLTPDRQKFPVTTESTLLICLHGKGDTAANFAKSWTDLVQSRTDVVIAVPEGTGNATGDPWGVDAADLVKAIIDDTVANDHVNPKHIILAGYGDGCQAGGRIMGEHPELFAGFADLAAIFPDAFFTPTVKADAANLAVYYAVGTKASYSPTYIPSMQQLQHFGFNNYGVHSFLDPVNLLVEKYNYADDATPDGFKYLVTRLMRFFDNALAENDKKNALAVTAAAPKTQLLDLPNDDLPNNAVVTAEKRTLDGFFGLPYEWHSVSTSKGNDWINISTPDRQKERASYVVVKNRSTLVKDFDLLIFAHWGVAADDAKTLSALVANRPNLIVVLPDDGVVVKRNKGVETDVRPPNYAAIPAIINDLVAHEGVNPRHVMLAGVSGAGEEARELLLRSPELYADFGLMDCDFQAPPPDGVFTPKLKEYTNKIAVYYAVDTDAGPRGNMFREGFTPSLKHLTDFGFSVHAEQPASGHTYTLPEVDSMMNYFDGALKKNDQAERKAAQLVKQ